MHFPRTAGSAVAIAAASGQSSSSTCDRIADSCGYAVPVMELGQERDVLDRWAAKKTPAELAAYRAEKNTVSIDGLPALDDDLAMAAD